MELQKPSVSSSESLAGVAAEQQSSPAEHAPVAWLARWRSLLLPVALILIVVLGGYFRALSLTDWDAGTGQHPDERFFTDVASSVNLPAGPAQYFDSARSPLNPRNDERFPLFVYGPFPITLTRFVAVTLTPDAALPETIALNDGSLIANPEREVPKFGWFQTLLNPEGRDLTGYYEIVKVGRWLALLFDLGSILLVYLIAARIFDRRTGLLAALLSALAVMQIQQVHFFVDPIFSTFFGLLALYWAVRAAQTGSWYSYALTGISIGVATANRITLVTIALIAIAAALLDALRRARRSRRNFWDAFLLRSFPLLCLAGLLTVFTYRTLQPDAFIGSQPDSPPIAGRHASPLDVMQGRGYFDLRPDPRFLENLTTVRSLVTGEFDFPPSQQWVNRPAYLFPWQNMVLWGMGPLLGITAWAGWLVFAAWRLHAFRRILAVTPPGSAPRFAPPHAAWLLWLWVAFYFGWQGAQFAITMRYMLPIYGALIIFAAWALFALWDWSREQRPDPVWLRLAARYSARWLPLLVVLATFAWAYAFSRIYTEPHSRVQAARWFISHAAPGSTVTAEVWDDPLPLQVDGQALWNTVYQGIDTAPYGEDDPHKYTGRFNANNEYEAGLLDQLERADYITLTSNRVYDSTSRLPYRYPALMRYYHYLFTGELGFDLVAEITSYPRLLGFSIPDQAAEEAFTVYDHPRVLIFRKTSEFSRERAEELITGDVNWGEVYKLPVQIADRSDDALRFTEREWPAYTSAGTWSAMFSNSARAGILAPLSWLLVLELLAAAGFVLLFRLLPALPDRGFSLAKSLALLLVAYAAWLVSALGAGRFPFAPLLLWACALPLLLAGGWLGWRSRAELLVFWRERRDALIMAQTLFLVFFALGLLLRWFNPDLWHPARGGEKPMDFAFLNAVLKSASFPPYDPWHAGGYINYYYFGFVFVGALVHLSGTLPAVGYNLAVAGIFALTALACWGVIYNLLAPRRLPAAARAEGRARVAALLAPLLVLLTGNLVQALWFANGYAAEQAAQGRAEWAFWDATRIVPGTVNEFPFFTFLFADLHAHMMVMPLSLALLGLSVAAVRHAPRSLAPLLRRHWPILLLMGLLAGTLRATNTWDYPSFVGLALLTLALPAWQDFRRRQRRNLALPALAPLLQLGLAAAIVLLAGNLLFLPFTSNFATESSGIELLRGERTSAVDLLRLYGFWLFVLLSAGLALTWRLSRGNVLVTLPVVLLGLLLPMAALAFELPALLLLLPLLLGWLALLWRTRDWPPCAQLPLIWGGAALGLLLLVEIVVVRGDVGRMNTVFKFGLHSWMLFGLAAAVALPWLWRAGRHALAGGSLPARGLVIGWRAVLLALLAAALVYPVTATPARLADRFAPDLPRTLDGAAFMNYVESGENGVNFPLAEDAAAIQWIQNNVKGTPVIVEAHLPSYRWAGRAATYTGLPTILGWEWHQIQQRMAVQAEPVIRHRQQVVSQIYNTPDPAHALRLLQDYGVEYVYLGGVERAIYDPAGLAKFATLVDRGMLDPAFSSGDTQVFRVVAPGEPTMLTTDLAIEPPSERTPPPLMLDTPVQELPATGAYVWQSPFGNHSLTALLLWLLAIYGIGLLGVPAAMLIFGRSRDAGMIWARLLGWLLLGYLVWLPTSLGLWRYDAGGIAGGLLLALLINGVLLVLLGRMAPAETSARPVSQGFYVLFARLRATRREWLIGETLFLGGFGLFAFIRALNPDLWHPIYGGEKPMGFGFLNAILRSPVMPPYDPFFSDGHINYYYYGLYLVSLPIRLTGIDPAIAFNLAIATIAGLTLVGAYWIVTRLTGRRRYGLIGAAFLGLLGNLAGFFAAGSSRGIGSVLQALFDGGPAGFGARLGDWYWGPSRVIPNTINEFPFFSFIFADLHPHLIALPLTLLAIALAFEFVVGPAGRAAMRLRLAFAALTLGGLAVTNSWDFPTYVLLTGAALSFGRALRGPGMCRASWRQRRVVLGRGLLLGGVLAVGSMALYAPFFDSFYPMVSGLDLVTSFTGIGGYLLLYGLFLAVLLPLLIGALQRSLGGWRNATPLLIVLAALLIAGIFGLPEYGLRICLLTLLLLLAWLLLRARMSPTTWFILLLAATAWGVSLGIEAIYIRDHLAGGDWYRMNTVFKFGMQIWTLLALAAAAGLPLVLRGLRRVGGPPAYQMGLVVLVLLIAMAAVYPLAGTSSRVANRFENGPALTLDGLAFLDAATFTYDCRAFGGCWAVDAQPAIDLSDDGAAIAWLNRNIAGTPIVVQAPLSFYRGYGIRVAANTGLPTVVSALHVNEQRDPFLAALRDREANELYQTIDNEYALRLLLKYRVDYIYVGPIERAVYPAEGLAKFAAMTESYLETVYDANHVQIYAVKDIPAGYAAPVSAAFGQPELPEPPADLPLVTANSDELAGLEAAVAADPTNAPLVFGLAERYRSLQRYDDADRVLAVAAAANPFDIGLHHLWGDILVEAGRYIDAEKAYMAAVRVDASAGNWNKVGVGLMAGGELDKAELAFNQALALDASVPEPYFRLGQIYAARNDNEAARDMLQSYLALEPAGQYVFDANELLNALEE